MSISCSLLYPQKMVVHTHTHTHIHTCVYGQYILCLPLSPRVCSDWYPLSWWCYLTISTSATPFFCFNLSQHTVFSNESGPHIWWPKYWSLSFSISPSNEYPGLISLRIDWFDLLAVSRVFSSTTIWKHLYTRTHTYIYYWIHLWTC